MPRPAIWRKPGPSGFGYRSTAEEVTTGLDLSGRTFLLTGCTAGIGFETLRVLGVRGGHVMALARTADAAQAALGEAGAPGTPVGCDLSEPGSVRAGVGRVRQLGRRIDAIICNAGIMALRRPERNRGWELQLATNHLGHFALVTALQDLLAPVGRVVVVSSEAHRRAPREGIRFDDLGAERHYSPFGHYAQSKLANILFTRALARRLAPGQTANALHPGVIPTRLARHMNGLAVTALATIGPLLFKSVAQGAATQCYLATHRQVAQVSGAYFTNCNVADPSRLAQDDALAEELWHVSEEAVAKW